MFPRTLPFLLSAAALLGLPAAGYGLLPGEEWDLNRGHYLRTISRILGEIESPTSPPAPPSRIYDRQGRDLAELPDLSVPHFVPYRLLPGHLVDAVVVMEDRNFFRHSGVDLRGIARAALRNLREGRVVEGGSTISQQVIKNLFTAGERTLDRKAFDIRGALDLEANHSKPDILSLYLNTVYLGHGCRGVELASRLYFGKPASQIGPAESALLAALLPSPNTLSPWNNPEQARSRQTLVLQRLREAGYDLDPDLLVSRFWTSYGPRYDPLNIPVKPLTRDEDPYWTAAVEAESRRILGRGDPEAVRTFTAVASVDLALQKRLRSVCSTFLLQQGTRTNGLQAAFVLLDNATGEVLAMSGGASFGPENQFNRALSARRQIGSLVKPFLYAMAFERGLMDPSTVLTDAAVVLRDHGRLWRPQNYDRRFVGPVTVTEALRQSRNIPALRTLLGLGTSEFVDFLNRVWGRDIAGSFRAMPSLALGTVEMTPLEVAYGFAVLASEGRAPPPQTSFLIRTLQDGRGEFVVDTLGERIRHYILEETSPRIDPEACRKVTEILRTVTEPGGTAFEAGRLERFTNRGRVACKTGTTANFRDAWTVLYDAELTLVVWVGYDTKPDPLPGAGGRLAAPLAFRLWKAVGRGPRLAAAP